MVDLHSGLQVPAKGGLASLRKHRFLRMTKEALNITLDSPSLDTIMQIENRTQMLCSTSIDLMEGINAFFEKRKPHYPKS